MKILRPDSEVDSFFSRLASNIPKVLFLDYDGTLAPFQIDPGQAVPYPGVREILQQINLSPTCRLVIVSGRYTKDLIPLLAMNPIPEIWGSHGLERLYPDGQYHVESISPDVLVGFQQARNQVKNKKILHRLEEKPGCLALHWRGMTERARQMIQDEILRQWGEIAQQFELELKSFDGGLELRMPGKNKGDAVRQVLSEMQGEQLIAYLGDDLTDEDAFRVIHGKGLGVLVRKELRETQADIWIQPPAELLDFLIRWRESCCK
jgi:trehalose 6-phosphate phosphatase